jgi:hypothetical protein
MGGFVMNVKTAAVWASAIRGRELHPPRDNSTILMVLFDKVRPYRVNFRDVGEVAGIDYMVITQSAWFKGYKDMDPTLIPQFEEREREAVARQLLEAEGEL